KGVGLAALVECHTVGELETALAVGARVVGINNRDLTTFNTRIETTLELLPRIPPGHIVVSESGFFTGDQVKRVAVAGAHAVLVGEALVTASDVPAKIRELRAVEAAGAVDASSHSAQTLGAVDASSHAARTGGEMGGATRPPHTPGAADASAPSALSGAGRRPASPAPTPSAPSSATRGPAATQPQRARRPAA